MKAKDIMSAPAVTIREDATLEEAARLMLDRHVGGLPVLDARGALAGFVTDSDFAAKERGVPFSFVSAPQVLGQWLGEEALERVYARARHACVRDVMSRPVFVVREDDPVERVVRTMLERDVNRVVVVRDGRPVGVVARHDLLRMLLPRSPTAPS